MKKNSGKSTTGKRSLRLAVVGYGAAACLVLGSLCSIGNFELVAAADTDAVVRDQFEHQFNLPALETFGDLLGEFAIDAVYVAAPTRFHEPLCVQALEAGVHALCEKPMATTIESALRMIDASEKAGCVLMECHKRSVDRSILTMWQLMNQGMIGQLRNVHRVHYSSWFYLPRAKDERDPTQGGVVLRQGAHEFDIIRFLNQSKPCSLRGWVGDYDAGRPGEGAYQAFVEFEGGALASSFFNGYDHFLSSELTYGLRDADAIGSQIRNARSLGIGADEGLIRRQHAPSYQTDVVTETGVFGFTLVSGESGDLRPSPDGGAYLYDETGRRQFRFEGESGTNFIAMEFYDAIVEGKRALHDGQWGLSVLELCLAVRESAKARASIDLVHQFSVPETVIRQLIGAGGCVEVR